MMKSTTLILGLALLAAPTLSFAEEKDHPCLEIKAACEAAGYQKGDHKKNGKGLYVDCMKKIMDGGAVKGVNVGAEKVAACKARKEQHQERKGKRLERRQKRLEKNNQGAGGAN
jgi:hypothetical protein